MELPKISITQRPEKTLTNGYTSRWSSSELPLKYTFESDLYPTNTYDTAWSITASAYNAVLKGLELAIGNHDLINLDKIEINGTGTVLDGGIFSIKGTTGTTIIIDYFSTLNITTGTVLKYYNNYNGVVKVYAGARDGHPYNTVGLKPFKLIGELVATFDKDNKASIDVRSYIKPDITTDFDSINDNSHYAWTDFTIEYSESYDKSDGSKVTTYNSDFVEDEQPNCTPFTGFEDPSFDDPLVYWSQDALPGSNGVFNIGVGEVTFNSGTVSEVLNQDLNIYSGVPYTLTTNYNVSVLGNNSFLDFVVYAWDGTTWDFLTFDQIRTTGVGTLVQNVTPTKDYLKLGILVNHTKWSGDPQLVISLTSMQVTTSVVQPCKIYSSAIFGVKQFQDSLGGNFGDYVLNIANTIEPKLLTNFKEIRKFQNIPNYFNALIPESTFTLSEGANNVFLQVDLFDSSNNDVLSFNYKVENIGSGVYTVNPNIDEELLNNNIELCGWTYGKVRFIIIPSNTFSDADNGTFEGGTVTGLTNLPYSVGTPNQIGADININAFGKTGVFSGRFLASAPFMNQTIKQYSIFKNDTSLNVVIGREYEIKSYISLKDTNVGPEQIDNGSLYWLPDGYTKEECIVKPFEIVIDNTYSTVDPTGDDWYEITTKFTAKATESLMLKMFNELQININISTGVEYNIDDITFKGPFEYVSEQKQINNSCGCSYNNILRWKNSLGGWEIWDFQNKRIESEIVSNKINIKRDVTQDWDNYFINGETENDTIKTDVSRSITFNSQILTNDEYKALQAIKRSVRVQMLQESGKWQTVTVKAGSYEVINDDKAIKELSITFELPSIQTQEQ